MQGTGRIRLIGVKKGKALYFSAFDRRDDWIRTSGLFVPNEARYRAALHPESGSQI